MGNEIEQIHIAQVVRPGAPSAEGTTASTITSSDLLTLIQTGRSARQLSQKIDQIQGQQGLTKVNQLKSDLLRAYKSQAGLVPADQKFYYYDAVRRDPRVVQESVGHLDSRWNRSNCPTSCEFYEQVMPHRMMAILLDSKFSGMDLVYRDQAILKLTLQDKNNPTRPDEWARYPLFFSRGVGDCSDFAMAMLQVLLSRPGEFSNVKTLEVFNSETKLFHYGLLFKDNATDQYYWVDQYSVRALNKNPSDIEIVKVASGYSLDQSLDALQTRAVQQSRLVIYNNPVMLFPNLKNLNGWTLCDNPAGQLPQGHRVIQFSRF